MPVLFIKQTEKLSKTGVWYITESSENLLEKCQLNKIENDFFETINHESRRKHWLSYRVLIQKMTENAFDINYTDFGKPSLSINSKTQHISVSHSGDYSAVIISKDARVGVDIEKISQRIERIASRFLDDDELSFLDKQNYLPHLTVCWTAKEALFKLFGNDFYDFREQIKLQSFAYSEKGEILASMYGEQEWSDIKVYYEKIADYFLAYVIL